MSVEPDRRPYNVLFLCTGNSCRSIMAEAIMNREGGGKFVAFSAGSFPTGEVNPHAMALLRKFNHPAAAFRSKSSTKTTKSAPTSAGRRPRS